MNILSSIDWRAVASDRPYLFPFTSPDSLSVLNLVAERGLLDIDVSGFLRSLDGDPLVDEVLKQSGLYVSGDGNYWQGATRAAPPVSSRPRTWLEAHPLWNDSWLVIPGDRTNARTLSFWRRRPDGRAGVVSLLADTGQITGLLVHGSKLCQEDFERTGVCDGMIDGCECEQTLGLDGAIVVDICDCAES